MDPQTGTIRPEGLAFLSEVGTGKDSVHREDAVSDRSCLIDLIGLVGSID